MQLRIGRLGSASKFIVPRSDANNEQQILPFFIVWSLRMNRKTKFLVVGILAFAAIGSTAAIIRMRYVSHLMNGPEFLCMHPFCTLLHPFPLQVCANIKFLTVAADATADITIWTTIVGVPSPLWRSRYLIEITQSLTTITGAWRWYSGRKYRNFTSIHSKSLRTRGIHQCFWT